jgi:hypothetical protein
MLNNCIATISGAALTLFAFKNFLNNLEAELMFPQNIILSFFLMQVIDFKYTL